MNNLYKCIKVNNIEYIIILEGNRFIKCISEQNDEIRTFNFEEDTDLDKFVSEHKI